MKQTLVSVIIPCYNQGAYLAEALDSLLAQTFVNWECIIVNDGSHDMTETVASKYCDRDVRFKYLAIENEGVSAARNFGILNSVGKYILPLDADDIIGTTYMQRAASILDTMPQVKLVYTEAEFFGERLGKWDLPSYSLYELTLSNMIFCSAFYRRSDFDNTNGYDISMKHGWEDWDFWIGLLKDGGEVIKLPEINFYYRIKTSSRNTTVNYNETLQSEIRRGIFLKHLDLYLKLHGDIISLIQNNNTLKQQHNQIVHSIKSSKRYKIGDMIVRQLSFLKKSTHR